jgi:chromosome segregation ATPase
MLGESDVQLVYRLLDSLTDSLKKLTTNYEILVRSGDANVAKSEELNKAISAVKAELAEIGKVVASLNNSISAGVDALGGWIDRVEAINHRIEDLAKAQEAHEDSTSKAMQGVTNDIRHLDQHADSGAQVAANIAGKLDELKKIESCIAGLKDGLAPLVKLSSHINKPLTVIIMVYIFLATLMAFWNVMGWVGEKWDKVTGKDKVVVVTNYVSTVSTAAPPAKAVP